MNIVFLTRLFYPHIGGAETHVLEISRLLVKKGHKVTIITELQEGLREREEIEGLEIRRIRAGRDGYFKKFQIWAALFAHIKVLKKADVIHCHDVFFWYLPFRLLFPLKLVFTTFHGFEGKYPISKKAIFIRKISEKLSNGNICVGKYIEKWYGTKANYITYGGIKNPASPAGRYELRIKNYGSKKDNKLKILFVGRLDQDTGILKYLKVLDELKKKNISFKFEVCGDGIFRNKIKKYGKVHGFVKNTEQLIMQSDIVFTSSYLSLLETMVLEKPIFALYENPLKKDYLTMTPFAKWIHISDNPKEVAGRIVQSKSLNMNEASNWAQKQTWENVVSLYLKLWEANV